MVFLLYFFIIIIFLVVVFIFIVGEISIKVLKFETNDTLLQAIIRTSMDKDLI